MQKTILAIAAGAALCATGAVADAMPVAGVPGAATPTPHIEKTVVVVTRTVVRRPPRRVCTTRIGPRGRTTVCRTR